MTSPEILKLDLSSVFPIDALTTLIYYRIATEPNPLILTSSSILEEFNFIHKEFYSLTDKDISSFFTNHEEQIAFFSEQDSDFTFKQFILDTQEMIKAYANYLFKERLDFMEELEALTYSSREDEKSETIYTLKLKDKSLLNYQVNKEEISKLKKLWRLEFHKKVIKLVTSGGKI